MDKFAAAFGMKEVLKNKLSDSIESKRSESDADINADITNENISAEVNKQCINIKISEIEVLRMEKLCNEIFVILEDKRMDMSRILLSRCFSYVVQSKYDNAKALPSDFTAVLSQVNKLENAAEGVNAFLRISNFSHSQLCRLTKRYLGMTPSEYINDIRMKYAMEMILNSDLDYDTVCETVGFSSLSHFYGLFVKKFGITPSAARRDGYGANRSV